MTSLFITTRYGLFGYSKGMETPVRLLTNHAFSDHFLFPVRGIFGISPLDSSGEFMVASRPVRRFPWFGKFSNVKKLHRLLLEEETVSITDEYLLRGVRDVHQITASGNTVFMADANMDRVICYNFDERKRAGDIYTNPEQDGHNHLNTVLVRNDTLYMGQNKTDNGSSRILKLDLDEVQRRSFPIHAHKHAEVYVNNDIRDTHDLVRYNGTFLSTASDDGYVFRIDTNEPMFEVSDWARGLVLTEKEIWVGSSEEAKRSERHQRHDGYLHRFNRNSREKIESIKVPDCGQVYDLIPVSDVHFRNVHPN